MQPLTTAEHLEGFCARIRSLDNSIRFAGLADYAGKLRASAYRQGLVPLMDRHETERYALQTVFRARTRGEFEPKLGRQKYAVAIYEKVIRVTLTIANPAKEYCNMYLLLSLDMITGFDSVIENKVLPFIREHKAELLERTASFSAEYSRFDKFK